MKNRTMIIAEAGVNHNGDVNIAKKMVEIAASAGADYIKFQTFKTENLVSIKAKLASYQQKNMENAEDSQYAMLKKLEMTTQDFIDLKAHCEDCHIGFLSTPFDSDSIAVLCEIGVPFWKIPSGEINDLPYLEIIAKTNREVVLSTGMSTIEEIQDAIDVIRRHNNKKITLLHCNTEYPTPYADVNLNAIATLRERFGLDVGYSDHTQGIEVSLAAVALGASIIEKHFTLDKTMAGPDHVASLNPVELKNLIDAIRNIEEALGSAEKKPSHSEMKNIAIARKSIVAKEDIMPGDIFSEQNITAKRPGNGISPMLWYTVIGQKAKKPFYRDELIEL